MFRIQISNPKFKRYKVIKILQNSKKRAKIFDFYYIPGVGIRAARPGPILTEPDFNSSWKIVIFSKILSSGFIGFPVIKPDVDVRDIWFLICSLENRLSFRHTFGHTLRI